MKSNALLNKLMWAVAAVGLFAFSYHWGNRYAAPKIEQISAFVFPHPDKIQPFQLMDEQGNAFGRKQLEKHWNWIMFGDLNDSGCKQLLTRYVLAWNYLADNPRLQQKTRVIFVDSQQPPKDTQQLAAAIDFFNPSFGALAGSEQQQKTLARQLGLTELPERCQPDQAPVGLVGPNGYLLALFTAVSNPAEIARDLKYFQ